jgi:hypothetical protein
MYTRSAVVLMAFLLGLGACTTVGGTPATTPPITEAALTTSTSTTTTMTVTTTTLDRLTEIQAIFQDLEVRRLQAIMDQDEEAFRSVFSNDEYAERSLVAMDLVGVIDPSLVAFDVVEVLADSGGCIAVSGIVDATGASDGGGRGGIADFVVEMGIDGWGLSWVGEGWRCDGPHPFSG